MTEHETKLKSAGYSHNDDGTWMKRYEDVTLTVIPKADGFGIKCGGKSELGSREITLAASNWDGFDEIEASVLTIFREADADSIFGFLDDIADGPDPDAKLADAERLLNEILNETAEIVHETKHMADRAVLKADRTYEALRDSRRRMQLFLIIAAVAGTILAAAAIY